MRYPKWFDRWWEYNYYKCDVLNRGGATKKLCWKAIQHERTRQRVHYTNLLKEKS